jgi:hypothetical protein
MTQEHVQEPAEESFEEAIGRQFAIAFVAYMGSITFRTAEKNYGHEPPSAYWVALGRQVADDYAAGRFGRPVTHR